MNRKESMLDVELGLQRWNKTLAHFDKLLEVIVENESMQLVKAKNSSIE